MKKAISIVLWVVLTIQLFGLNIIASHVDDSVDENRLDNDNIIVKRKDGSEEIIVPNFGTSSRGTSTNVQQYAPYIPADLEVDETFARSVSDLSRMASLQSRIPNNLKVVEAKEFPYTTIGYLTTDSDCGTAFLVGPDLVLTAAHCVFNKKNNTWATNIKFYFGLNNTKYLSTASVATNWSAIYIQQEYVNQSDFNSQYDWAIIQIDQPAGYSQGWLGFHGCSSQENYKENMAILGYPNDKDVHVSSRLEVSEGSFYKVDGNIMRYRMFIVMGMSGGPAVDSNFCVYAINSYSTDSLLFNGGGYMFGDYLFNMVADALTDSIERWE